MSFGFTPEQARRVAASAISKGLIVEPPSKRGPGRPNSKLSMSAMLIWQRKYRRKNQPKINQRNRERAVGKRVNVVTGIGLPQRTLAERRVYTREYMRKLRAAKKNCLK